MQRVPGYANRAPRVDLRRPAVVIDSDGQESSVIILDISSGGFRLEVPATLRIGERVTLRVDQRDELPAQIRWALGNEAGGIFLTSAGCDLWGTEESAMADDTSKSGDGSGGEERRKGERRDGDRRAGGRKTAGSSSNERRKGDRRKD